MFSSGEKTFSKLGDIFKGGFKPMTAALGKFKAAATGGLKAILMAAGLFLLIEFLQSKTWKKIRKWIAKNPLEGVMIALVAVAAFFSPLKTLKVIKTLIGNVVLYVQNISKFFLWLGKTLGKGILGSFKLMGKFVKVVAVSLEGYGKLFKTINASFAKGGEKLGKIFKCSIFGVVKTNYLGSSSFLKYEKILKTSPEMKISLSRCVKSTNLEVVHSLNISFQKKAL